MEEQTNISVKLISVVALLGAATKLLLINRAKNLLKGSETQDEGLEDAITDVTKSVREAVGQ